MKKKSDFITNSSSVSFIIGSKPNVSLKVPMVVEVDLSHYINQTCSTLEELKKYWMEELYAEEDDKEYIESQSLIKEGKVVHFLHCNDEDDHLEAMLCVEGLNDLKLPDNIKVIQGQGGY